MKHTPETAGFPEGENDMTREKAVEAIVAHLQFSKSTLESQDIPTQDIDHALESLQAGDPKPAIDILLEEIHDHRVVEAHPTGDGSGPNESDRALAGKEADMIAEWIDVLKEKE